MKYTVELDYRIDDCRMCPFKREYRLMDYVPHDEYRLSQVTGIEQQIVECGITGETIKNPVKPLSKECPLKQTIKE